MGWGIISSRRGLKKLDVFVWLMFVLLLAMGWGAIYAIWDAGK
jgi:succinate dehydrogenase / fumarate reductase cytochrome b subunit